MDYKNEKDYYFGSYSRFYIHEDMIKDKVYQLTLQNQIRTESYREAIMRNAETFKDKVIIIIKKKYLILGCS